MEKRLEGVGGTASGIPELAIRYIAYPKAMKVLAECELSSKFEHL